VNHQDPAAGTQVAADTFVTIGVAPAPPAACP
jgi:hypothetical protein